MMKNLRKSITTTSRSLSAWGYVKSSIMDLGRIIILAGMSLALALPVMAQDKKPEQLTAVFLTLERKRDVSIDDFEAGLKKHLEFRLKDGEGRNYQVCTPVEAGDYLKFYVRHCCVTLAEQDAADKRLYGSNIVVSYKDVLAPILGLKQF